MFKKLMKGISVLSLMLCTFCSLNMVSVNAANENTITPFALTYTVPVSKSFTVTNSKIDEGNTVTFKFTLTGSYTVTESGVTSKVSNVDLSFSSVTVYLNGSKTSLINGRISKVVKTNGSDSVSVTYTLQYKNSGSTSWIDLKTDTVVV